MPNQSIYYFFLGIGGIGMSAIARYYLERGEKVYGYDKTQTSLTDKLSEEGANIIYKDLVNAIPKELANKEQVQVIYTPAIPKNSQLFEHFTQKEYKLLKRAQALGEITRDTTNLSVAGTHGKTTTACLLASIFKHSSEQFSAFLGGISADFNSNYYYQSGNSQHFSITEADEYDRSFLQLTPFGAVITSTDADHLDVYHEKSEMEETYGLFAGLVSEPTCLFRAGGTAINKGETYSVEGPTNFSAQVHEISSTGSRFSILKNKQVHIADLFLSIPGKHNLENAIGASLLAEKVGVSHDAIKKGLTEFKGIKRRFEVVFKSADSVYIDDYAHHPSELAALISSVKEIYPNRHITAVFQPHLYSRTRDFLAGFGKELSKVNSLILLPIYPARELPIEGIDSEKILDYVTITEKKVVQKPELMAVIEKAKPDVLLTLGAGDIDRFVEPIKRWYETN